MKKIKYLLALCMSIICIGAVSVHASVDTTMAQEITLFENLGFTLPEKTAETDFVTRGEFIGTLTQFFNREFAMGGEYSFTDVPKSSDLSGALNYAVAMGIVSDDTMFYPDNNVTYNQAMKMAVTFLGRGLEAEAAGGYDGGGYNSVASTLKLYSGLQDVAGENVTLRDFYKIMYNVGQAKMLVRDIYNNISTGNAPFVEYFNMYQIRGTVTMNEDTGLKDNYVNSPIGTIAINNDLYRYNGDAPLGYRVDGWARNVQGDMPEILLLKEYNNETAEVSLVGLEGRVEGNYFYYDEAGKDEKIKIKDPAIIYNDIAAPTMKVTDIFKCKLGTATFIDNDSDGYYNVIKIEEYRPVVVSVTSTMSMRISDKNGATAVDLNDNKVKKYTIIKEGAEIELKDLAKDDFLVVYESKKGDFVRVEVLTSTVSGNVSSINSTGRTIKIGSVVYDISDYFNKYYMSKVNPNSDINVFVTPDNVVHAFAEEVASTNKYGFIIKWWEDEETGKLKIRMADNTGAVHDVVLAKSVTLDGVSGAKKDDVVNRLAILEGRGRANLIVKYKLSEDGTELKVIDTYDQLTSNDAPQNILTGNENSDNNLTEWNFPQATETNPALGNQYYNKDGQGWAPYVSKINQIFVIQTGDDIEEDKVFKVTDTAALADAANDEGGNRRNRGGFANRAYRIFNVDRFGTAEAAVIVISKVDPTITKEDPKGIVYRISRATNPAGEITYEMVLFSSGEYKTYCLSEDYYEELTTGGMTFAVGDYIAYKVDVTDEIVKCEVIYDKSEGTVAGSYLTTPNYLGIDEAAFVTGWVYDLDGSSISIIPAGYFNERLNAENIGTFKLGTDALLGFPVGGASINMISPDGKTIAEGSMGDVTTFLQSPDDAEFVIIGFDEGALQEIILYK